jgi:predicted metal-binding protein
MDGGKVVSFRTDEGISQKLIQRLTEKGKDYGLNAIFPFDVEKLVIANWVRLKCMYGCKQYNTSWCCPPVTPDAEKAREIISEYKVALLLVGNGKCSDFYLDNQKKRANQVRYWKGTVSLERLLFLEGYYKAFSLVSGACALCKKCAYPENCRFPQEKRPTIESFAIDVIGTLKALGTSSKIARGTRDTFGYYGIILLE